jgi:hypothetical protein
MASQAKRACEKREDPSIYPVPTIGYDEDGQACHHVVLSRNVMVLNVDVFMKANVSSAGFYVNCIGVRVEHLLSVNIFNAGGRERMKGRLLHFVRVAVDDNLGDASLVVVEAVYCGPREYCPPEEEIIREILVDPDIDWPAVGR